MRTLQNMSIVISFTILALAIPLLASAEIHEITAYSGGYVYAGGPAQQKVRTATVESIVGEMNVIIRAIARQQLLKNTQPWPRIDIAMSGKNLSIKRAGRVPATVVLGGAPISFRNGISGRSTVRRRFARNSIIEVINDGSSNRTNTFSLASGGKVLNVRGQIHSPQLPRDVVVNFTYRRQ